MFKEALRLCSPEKFAFDCVEPRAQNTGFAVPRARFDVKLDLSRQSLWVFGAGKAAASMAKGVLDKLEPQVRGGAVLIPEGVDALGVEPLRVLRGTHPSPTQKSAQATQTLVSMLKACSPRDHVIFVLSGGASSLLVDPVDGVSIDQLGRLSQALLGAGIPIEQINTVRKHLSKVSGGQLLNQVPCEISVFVLSDVCGNDFSVIGSGPFAKDLSTREQARQILRRASEGMPDSLAVADALIETPKELSRAARARHVLVADHAALANVAGEVARNAGFKSVTVDSRPVTEDLEQLVRRYSQLIVDSNEPQERLLIFYGEPVVRLPARPGRGGRSQHLGLMLAQTLKGVPGWTFLAGCSDGVDGTSKFAGCVVDGDSYDRAKREGIDVDQALETFNSAEVHEKLGQALDIGPSGNNLLDLHLLHLVKGLEIRHPHEETDHERHPKRKRQD
ncbi:MAG: DUF4147 domain-containing protein [Bdellovibrionota bacterium]